jgi:ribonuclease HI
MIKEDFQVFLYKNKLNEKNLIDILDKLSEKSILQLMDDLKYDETSTIYVFSDGNCKNNGKKHARGGYSIFFPIQPNINYSEFNKTKLVNPEKEVTNNICELSAIRLIFKTILNNIKVFSKEKTLVICTDSQYSINCITKWNINWEKNNWKNSKGESVKNKELIQDIIDKFNQINNKSIKIKFKHVHSHLQEPKNKNSMEYFLWFNNDIVDSNINKMLKLNE